MALVMSEMVVTKLLEQYCERQQVLVLQRRQGCVQRQGMLT